ncbi:MAG: HRDC domain-containing protein [Solirubrobacterales bacterium]
MLKKNGLIKRRPVNSVVVVANPKSIINRSKAPAYIKNDIIKYDQITDFLVKMNKKEAPNEKMIESRMINIANFILQSNIEVTYDYYKKYGLTDEDFYDIANCKDQLNSKEIIEVEVETIISESNDKQCKINDDLFEKLKKYRYEKALTEGVKAYCIFTNNTLEELIKKQPKNLEELLRIQGFGKVKVEKYGADILKILSSHSKSHGTGS